MWILLMSNFRGVLFTYTKRALNLRYVSSYVAVRCQKYARVPDRNIISARGLVWLSIEQNNTHDWDHYVCLRSQIYSTHIVI